MTDQEKIEALEQKLRPIREEIKEKEGLIRSKESEIDQLKFDLSPLKDLRKLILEQIDRLKREINPNPYKELQKENKELRGLLATALAERNPTYAKLASELGVSASRAGEIYKAALKKLRLIERGM